jgi:hypothetical protein
VSKFSISQREGKIKRPHSIQCTVPNSPKREVSDSEASKNSVVLILLSALMGTSANDRLTVSKNVLPVFPAMIAKWGTENRSFKLRMQKLRNAVKLAAFLEESYVSTTVEMPWWGFCTANWWWGFAARSSKAGLNVLRHGDFGV